MKANLAGMEWEVCGPAPGALRTSRITINLGERRASLTEDAYNAAGKPDAVVLLYSAEHKTIGLRPVPASDPMSVLLSHSKGRTTGHQLSSGGLVRRMKSDGYTGSISVPLQWHPDGLLWGDLTMATKFQRKSQAKGGVV